MGAQAPRILSCSRAVFFCQLNWAFMKALGTPLAIEGFPRRGRDRSLLWGPGARGGESSWTWRLALHPYFEAGLWRQVRSSYGVPDFDVPHFLQA